MAGLAQLGSSLPVPVRMSPSPPPLVERVTRPGRTSPSPPGSCRWWAPEGSVRAVGGRLEGGVVAQVWTNP